MRLMMWAVPSFASWKRNWMKGSEKCPTQHRQQHQSCGKGTDKHMHKNNARCTATNAMKVMTEKTWRSALASGCRFYPHRREVVWCWLLVLGAGCLGIAPLLLRSWSLCSNFHKSQSFFFRKQGFDGGQKWGFWGRSEMRVFRKGRNEGFEGGKKWGFWEKGGEKWGPLRLNSLAQLFCGTNCVQLIAIGEKFGQRPLQFSFCFHTPFPSTTPICCVV